MFVGKKSSNNKENWPPDIKTITCTTKLEYLDCSFSGDNSVNESLASLANMLTQTTANLTASRYLGTSRIE